MTFSYQAGNSNTDLAINSLQIANDFGFMTVDVRAANTYSRNNSPNSPLFQFTQTGVTTAIPINTTPDNILSYLTYKGPAQIQLNSVSQLSADYKENDQDYKGDFKIPFNTGSFISGYFKFGGDYR